MTPLSSTVIVSGSLFAALLLGRRLHRLLPEHHLSSDSKDAVKLAMGLVATMTALLLGLLVSSAKSNYDTQRGQVIQLAAKVVFLDRVLSLYGPETADVRHELRSVVAESVQRIWPEARDVPAQLSPDEHAGDAFYIRIQRLSPRDDTQRSLKAQAVALAVELGQLRTLLVAQSAPSVSRPLLIVVVGWLVIIFFSSSLLAPPNATTALALVAAACSVAGAVFLILELDEPFGGMLRISSEPMLAVLRHMAQ